MWTEAEDFDLLIDDQLVRLEGSFKELSKEITITIDGQPVTINQVVPGYDAFGREARPRRTTIYDALAKMYSERARDVGEVAVQPNADNADDAGVRANFRKNFPVPVLCHQEHMRPVAVCRVCMVDIGGRRLVPACQQFIKPGMVVKTDSERIRKAVRVVTELLITDHQSPVESWREYDVDELMIVKDRMGVTQSRFPKSVREHKQDESSPLISVDLNACILCDRCIRACNEVKENGVIARMNKGAATRIAFDFDDPMGKSSCVACGECMISCPTGALSNKAALEIDLTSMATSKKAKSSAVTADELLKHPLFQDISRRFLEWCCKAIVRRAYKKGDTICSEGEFGSTAFVIESGEFSVHLNTSLSHVTKRPSTGLFSWLGRMTTGLSKAAISEDQLIPSDSPAPMRINAAGKAVATLSKDDLLFGEMACMNHYPRAATVTAASDDCEVLEILRNVLYMLQRNKSSKKKLDDRYRQRSLDTHLRQVPLFRDLPAEVFDAVRVFLRDRVRLVRVHPGQVICRQGEPADHFYLVRVGFVKISQRWQGGDRVVNYIGPGGYFGEIGLLARIPSIRQSLDIVDSRVATCTALDHVDLVRLDGDDFRLLLDAFLPADQQSDLATSSRLSPEATEQLQQLRQAVQHSNASGSKTSLIEQITQTARERLNQNREMVAKLDNAPLDDFLRQGLMEAKNLLVLDLENCTRCDECTKACANTHDDHLTRLIREGLRFDKYLVASSCRTCLDPYCMVGCPVGSIQRNSDGTILIKDWCIGCGLCERNCPYGNITMHESTGKAAAGRKAVTCDYCEGVSGPSCVYACPHDAAHRMTGADLMKIVAPQPFSG